MAQRIKRRTLEQYRYFLVRAARAEKEEVRRRAVQLLKEFLQVERLPRRVGLREVEQLLRAVFEGRTRVPWMYNWVARYRGRWLSIKWSWYIRTKEYWRSKFEELKEAWERANWIYKTATSERWIYELARLAGLMDGRAPTAEELCTVEKRYGPAARFFLENVRAVIVTLEDVDRFTKALAEVWPNKMFRLIVFSKRRPPDTMLRESEASGYYSTKVVGVAGDWFISSYRMTGKDVRDFIRRYRPYIDGVKIYSLAPPPPHPECLRT